MSGYACFHRNLARLVSRQAQGRRTHVAPAITGGAGMCFRTTQAAKADFRQTIRQLHEVQIDTSHDVARTVSRVDLGDGPAPKVGLPPRPVRPQNAFRLILLRCAGGIDHDDRVPLAESIRRCPQSIVLV